jgi:hypothetical protein
MQSGLKAILLLAVAVLAVGCAEEAEYGDLENDVYPRYEEGYGAEPDTANENADVQDVELGWGVDDHGMIPENMRDDNFGTTETIHLSMKVDDAAPGEKVRLVVFDEENDHQVMSTEQTVDAAAPYLHFTIDKGKLTSGDYRAEVMIGTDTVAEEEFTVTTEAITRDKTS